MEASEEPSQLPSIVLIGPIPSSLAPTVEDLAKRFVLIEYKPASKEEFLADLQSTDSNIYSTSAILRLGSFSTTNLQHDWAHSVCSLPTLPPTLKLLINNAHGLDSQPVAALAARGVTILGSGGGTNTTATAALYLTIGAFRHFSRAERAARSQDTGKFFEAMGKAWGSRDPAGKSVGIVGYGRIGQRVGELLSVIGMEIHCFKRGRGGQPSVKENGVVIHGDLDEMLQEMDCVLLCCPYSQDTHHLLNWERIKRMKSGVRIVNVARGKCIDEKSLIKGLEEGIIGGLGLDVYEAEPEVNPKLLEFENISMLPHVGGQSVESIENHIRDSLRLVNNFFYAGHSTE